jgi:hypothetical protein
MIGGLTSSRRPSNVQKLWGVRVITLNSWIIRILLMLCVVGEDGCMGGGLKGAPAHASHSTFPTRHVVFWTRRGFRNSGKGDV